MKRAINTPSLALAEANRRRDRMNTSSSGSPSSSQGGSDPIDLAKLEEVARAATQADWFWAQGRSYDLKQWALCPGLLMADGADGTPGGDMLDRANALHIATFDPPTVLRLIELARVKS